MTLPHASSVAVAALLAPRQAEIAEKGNAATFAPEIGVGDELIATNGEAAGSCARGLG